MIPLLTDTGGVEPIEVVSIVAMAAGFFLLVSFLGALVLPHPVNHRFWSRIPLIRHFGFRHILSFDSGGKTTLTLLLYALLMGLLAH